MSTRLIASGFCGLFLIVGCVGPVPTLRDADNGGTVMIPPGAPLVLELASSPSTGYAWQLVAVDEVILRVSAHQFIAPKSTLVGAPGTERWTFTAGAQGGSTVLRLEYRRPWESPETPAAQVFSIEVDVNAV